MESWKVAVPVASYEWTVLHPEHNPLSVRVDLGAIDPFCLDHDAPLPRHGFADFQLNADANVRGRLGSGRSLVLDGFYLKGIGRTQLAGNWSFSWERYHNSGHMLPSAAVREYLVSRLFEALGEKERIVPCEGLMLAPAGPHAPLYAARVVRGYRGDVSRISTLDRHLMGATIKRAGFVRFSNVLWSSSRLGHDVAAVVELLRELTASLAANDPDVPRGATPSQIVAALDRGIRRGLDNFLSYPLLGIYFGSFHNNFTADGRFLDLELPLVLGRPFVGVRTGRPLAAGTIDVQRHAVIGAEVLQYVAQARASMRRLRSDLHQFLLRPRKERLPVDRFVEALLEGMGRLLEPTHPLGSDEWVLDESTARLARALHWNREQSGTWRRVLAGVGGSGGMVDVRPVAHRPHDAEPGATSYLSALGAEPLFAAESGFELGSVYDESVRRIEEARDPDTALRRVEEGATEIKRAAEHYRRTVRAPEAA